MTTRARRRLVFSGRRRSADWSGDLFAATKLDYALNLVAAGIIRPTKHPVHEMELIRRLVNVPEPLVPEGSPPWTRTAAVPEDAAVIIKKLHSLVRRWGRTRRAPRPPEAPAADNVIAFASAVGLDDPERLVLEFAMACKDRDTRDFLAFIKCSSIRAVVAITAAAIGQPAATVEKALSPSSRLITTGLLVLNDHGDMDDRLDVDQRLLELLPRADLKRTELLEQFLPLARPPTLSVDDFAHLAAPVDLARRLMAAALAAKRAGVNLLFVGPTGTGKSELARVLAVAMEASIFVAGREDDGGESPSARQRLTSLLLGQALLGASRSVLLFDELEDLFEQDIRLLATAERRQSARMSKQWFNRLLETNAVPTIWISNDVGAVDPAFLRRFSYVIEVGALTTSQRRRVWSKHLGENALPSNDIEALAQNFHTSPAEIGNAVSATRLAMGGSVDRATLEAVLTPTQKILHGRKRHDQHVSEEVYVPEVVNTTVDLAGIAARLGAWRPSAGPGVSLCLYGPPGTGKSAYVRYVARQMDRPLIVRRASDLLSKWVGGSEENIASAFDEAASENAVLLFDEADSFLRDRRAGLHSWEITLTNEFLQQIETFTGIVACTTNLFATIDQAALRRFTFKIPFMFMKADQAACLFVKTVRALNPDVESAPIDEANSRDLVRLETLTPGDFAAAARRLRTLGEPVTPRRLLEELRAEVAVKEARPSRIGFER